MIGCKRHPVAVRLDETHFVYGDDESTKLCQDLLIRLAIAESQIYAARKWRRKP